MKDLEITNLLVRLRKLNIYILQCNYYLVNNECASHNVKSLRKRNRTQLVEGATDAYSLRWIKKHQEPELRYKDNFLSRGTTKALHFNNCTLFFSDNYFSNLFQTTPL